MLRLLFQSRLIAFLLVCGLGATLNSTARAQDGSSDFSTRPIFVITRVFQMKAKRDSYPDLNDQVFRMSTASLAEYGQWMKAFGKSYPGFEIDLLRTESKKVFRTAKPTVISLVKQPDGRDLEIQMFGAQSVGDGTTPRVIESSIEVAVPVSAAYNQWTQFEEFPQFMQGVEEVRQLGDTRLHWVASIGGRRAEWDAKILEQHPDRQISWISEDGKKTRGTVTFEPVGDARTRVQLSMSYQAEGIGELVGSAAGLDTRRVRSDLERFKNLIEERGTETGAWRGEISSGHTD